MSVALTGKSVKEQAPLVVHSDRIDRENGVLKRVHLQGPISKWGHRYDASGMRKASTKFEGLVCCIDHDYKGGPMKVNPTWGTVQAPIDVDDEGIWGDLAFVKCHEQTGPILEAAERGLNKIGLSPVNNVIREQNGVIFEYEPQRIDLVIGAATTKGLFEQAPEEGAEEKSADDHIEDSIHSAVSAILKGEGMEEEKCDKLCRFITSMMKREKKDEEGSEQAGTAKAEKTPEPTQAATMEQYVTREQFNALKASIDDLGRKIVLRAQFTPPKSTIEQQVATILEQSQQQTHIDPKKFWDEYSK
jgi:hypothetical protein